MVLGISLNNPYNIRYNPLYKWLGSDGSQDGFVRFSSIEYGVRAAILLLRTYCRNGLLSVSQIIMRYAPPSENNSRSYIKYCKKAANLPDGCISSVDDVLRLLVAMGWFESHYEVSIDNLKHIMNKYNISEYNFFTNSKF